MSPWCSVRGQRTNNRHNPDNRQDPDTTDKGPKTRDHARTANWWMHLSPKDFTAKMILGYCGC